MEQPLVHRLTPEREVDFQRVHCDPEGSGWCACVAWWVPTWEGWGKRSAEQNAALRRELFARDEHDGYLAYVDGEPVGWCQAGPRDRLAKLVRQFELEPDPGAWAVTCFLVRPAFRRRGLSRLLLRRVVEAARGAGASRLEAFPKRGATGPGELWNGPEQLFLAEGFAMVRDEPLRPVLALRL